ncbi:MAG: DUF3592 domain-containing protein [Chitinophagaceae bacterium]
MENIVPMLIGIFLNTFAIRLIMRYKTLAASGITTDGVIYGPAESGKSVMVRFQTSDGNWITEPDTNRITGSFLKVNDKVTVIYNLSNPQDFMIKTKYTNVLLAGFALAGTGLIVLGLSGVGG